MKKLIDQIFNTLKKKFLLDFAKNFISFEKPVFLCGISGGQDSNLLMIILLHFQTKTKYSLHLIYCQHFWQKKNFFILWHNWKLAFLFEIPISFVLTEKYLFTEKSARKWRRDSYKRVSDLQNCKSIILGHTGSDRLETALLNLIRGASPKGLTTLNWQNNLEEKTVNQIFSTRKHFQSFTIESSGQHNRNSFQIQKNITSFKQTCLFSKNLFCEKEIELNTFYKSNFLIGPAKINKQVISKSILLNKTWKHKKIQNKSKKKLVSISDKKKQKTFKISFFNKPKVKNCTKIVRPLLGLHRSDIAKWIRMYQIPIINDSTNQDSTFRRNRIRNQLFPVVRHYLNRNFDQIFYQFLEISSDEQDYLKKLGNNIYVFSSFRDQESKIFTQLPIFLQRYLIANFFKKSRNKSLTYSQIEILRILILNR